MRFHNNISITIKQLYIYDNHRLAKISTTKFGKFSFHDEKHEVFCWRQCWWMQPCVFFIPRYRCQLLHLYFVLTIFFETGKHAKNKAWYFGMIVVSEDVFRHDILQHNIIWWQKIRNVKQLICIYLPYCYVYNVYIYI